MKKVGRWERFGKGWQQEITGTKEDRGPHKTMATPLQTAEQRDKLRGKAFTYARALLIDPDKMKDLGVGRSPFAHIDAETIAQRAYQDGYIAALRDVRKGKA